MQSEQLLPRLKKIIVDALELGVKPESLPDDLDLGARDGIGLDSIEAVALILALEHEFKIRLNPDEMEVSNLSTLPGMVELVDRKLKEMER